MLLKLPFVTIYYKLSRYFTIYTGSDFKIDMISSLKRSQVSLTTETYEKCAAIHKKLGFQDLCKENTKQQLDISKLGKFVVHNLKKVKLNLKLQKNNSNYKY